MADSLICQTGTKAPGDGFPLFQRRIEFHLARKPFSFGNEEGSDFHLETLNPGAPDIAHSRPNNPNSCSLASAGKKLEGDDLFEHGLDQDLSFGFTFRRIVSWILLGFVQFYFCF